MIKPMLAVPAHKGNIQDYSEWIVEEKFDGHRLIVEVYQGPDRRGMKGPCLSGVRAWTRPRKHAGSDDKTMATYELPFHLQEQLGRLPVGIYDGELLGGETSTDVRRTDLRNTLRYVVFDVLQSGTLPTMGLSYSTRRLILMGSVYMKMTGGHVLLAHSQNVMSEADVMAFVQSIWKRGGEGGILKRKDAPYQPGKRSPDFIKLKKLQSTVVTVIGFEPTRGTKMNRGPFAIVKVRDSKGCETTVKTKDDFELRRFMTEWSQSTKNGLPYKDSDMNLDNAHPALGRKLRIEYQDWTPKGGYRHPRWDRWESE